MPHSLEVLYHLWGYQMVPQVASGALFVTLLSGLHATLTSSFGGEEVGGGRQSLRAEPWHRWSQGLPLPGLGITQSHSLCGAGLSSCSLFALVKYAGTDLSTCPSRSRWLKCWTIVLGTDYTSATTLTSIIKVFPQHCTEVEMWVDFGVLLLCQEDLFSPFLYWWLFWQ